jgi:hypothetical protein
MDLAGSSALLMYVSETTRWHILPLVADLMTRHTSAVKHSKPVVWRHYFTWQLPLIASCQGTYRTSVYSDDHVWQLWPVPVSWRKTFLARCEFLDSHSSVDVVSLLLEHAAVSLSVRFLMFSDQCIGWKHCEQNTQRRSFTPQKIK